jgi:hypothetical protein
MPHTLLHTLTALRFQAHTSYPEHRSDATAFEVTKHFLEGGYRALQNGAQGDLHTYTRGDQVRGYLMHWHQGETWYGAPTHTYALDFDWADPDATRWATQTLLQTHLHEDAELMLNARYAPILGVALGAGLNIDSVILLGAPKKSLDRLMSAYAPPQHLGAMNLDIQPLTKQTEIDLTIALKQRYFTAHPEHCWFGANERALKHSHQELTDTLNATRRGHRPPARAWVLYREGAFMGTFSYTDTPSHPLWGPLAGVDITLHPLIQHRGVVKTAYRVMLTAMIQSGVQTYKGGTSQPAVMALGRAMGRPLFSWVLRKRATLPTHHFSPYLPPHLRSLERGYSNEGPP